MRAWRIWHGSIAPYSDEEKNAIKVCKKYLKVSIFCLIMMALTPTKQTIIQMFLAKSITYDLVDQTTDIVATVYNDLISLFGE